MRISYQIKYPRPLYLLSRSATSTRVSNWTRWALHYVKRSLVSYKVEYTDS